MLFGGLAAANALRGDTWLWDGTNWTQAQDTGPGARRAHVQAYDAVRSEVVLFGGDSGSGAVGDTWTWDGTVWTQRAHFGPPPSASAALVFDGTVALLYGGVASLTDPNAKVFAGTWQWDGAHWAQRQDIGPGARLSIAMAFDTARGCAVLFGGVAVSPASQTASDHLLGDTWEEQGSGPPAQLTALTVNPATVAAGDTTTIEADLSQRAPAGGAVVVVTADGRSRRAERRRSGRRDVGDRDVHGSGRHSAGRRDLTGRLAGSARTATLHVTGAGGGATMAAFTVTPSTIQSSLGDNLVFQVDLTAPAPQDGVAVAVTYQANSIGTISIAAGSTSGQIAVSVGAGQVPPGQYQFDERSTAKRSRRRSCRSDRVSNPPPGYAFHPRERRRSYHRHGYRVPRSWSS